MAKTKNSISILKCIQKFLSAIVTLVAGVKINNNPYPFSKEFKALNQDFIAIGNDLRAAINKTNKTKTKNNNNK